MNTDLTVTLTALMALLPDGAFLAGGAIRANVLKDVAPEEVRDIDVFFRDDKVLAETIRTLMLNGWAVHYGEANASGPGVATTARHPDHALHLDLVSAWKSPNIYTLLYMFDFRACQFGWSASTGTVILPGAYEDARDRMLYLVHIDGKAERIKKRVIKYIDRGWSIDPKSHDILSAAEKEDKRS